MVLQTQSQIVGSQVAKPGHLFWTQRAHLHETRSKYWPPLHLTWISKGQIQLQVVGSQILRAVQFLILQAPSDGGMRKTAWNFEKILINFQIFKIFWEFLLNFSYWRLKWREWGWKYFSLWWNFEFNWEKEDESDEGKIVWTDENFRWEFT